MMLLARNLAVSSARTQKSEKHKNTSLNEACARYHQLRHELSGAKFREYTERNVATTIPAIAINARTTSIRGNSVIASPSWNLKKHGERVISRRSKVYSYCTIFVDVIYVKCIIHF